MNLRGAVDLDRSWRRKPQARAVGYETQGVGFQDQPTPRWILEGPHAEEDLARVMAGLICVRCWQPFPERLGPQSVRRIMEEMGPFIHPDPWARKLIVAGHCPMCSTEVSPDMAQAFFKGIDDSPRGAEIHQGEHGEYEQYIDDTPPLYMPAGWDR